MRAAGAAVGVGELLAAHRALDAVDPASRRDAFFALRTVMCATRADFGVFAEAFAAVFAVAEDSHDPLEQLGKIERSVLPRMGIPTAAEGRPELVDMPVPSAYSEEE